MNARTELRGDPPQIVVPTRARAAQVSVSIEPAHEMLNRLIARLTKTWWRLEALFEKWRMAMADGYEDPTEDLDQRASARRINLSGQARFGDEWRKRRNSVIDTLLIMGIAALVTTSIYLLKTTVKLETTYTERGLLYDERFDQNRRDNERQDALLSGHDKRLDSLEQQRRITDD